MSAALHQAARPPAWYRLAWLLALPLAALYLAWRALRQREYLRHWGERFLGRAGVPTWPAGAAPRHVYWVHAVSVGETRAAQPLIERLAAADPQACFVLTHMTPTGRQTGAALAAQLDGRLVQRYLPYDLPGAVRRFLAETRPAVGVLIETETWPNLLAGAQRAGVPVLLVNARLSARSLARAARAPRLIRATAARLARVVAQTESDAARIRTLYDGPVDVAGNLKFDLEPSAELRARGQAWRARCAPRPVWLFANTRDGEEALLLDAIAAWRRAAPAAAAALPDPQLIFVPRHPQRFDVVARLIAARGHAVVRRSEAPQFDRPWQPGAIVLGDTMGEMAAYYAAADVALVGGSLAALGGHNLIEACACGCAVVVGPHTFNFAQASDDAIAAGAALRVPDAAGVLAAFAALRDDPERLASMRRCAAAFALAHRGATARTAAIVLQVRAGARQSAISSLLTAARSRSSRPPTADCSFRPLTRKS